MGEVIAASAALRERGLSERGFHALIAIAEKSDTASRQGSVRWDHIRAGLYGASLSTAKRAIRDLKDVGAIRIVKRGYNNQNGQSAAPIYEIASLTERVTQVTYSPTCRTGHSDDTFAAGPTGHLGDPLGWGRTGQNGDRTGHSDDLLDVSIDVDPLRDRGTSPGGPSFVRGPHGLRCPRHGHLQAVPEDCNRCQDAISVGGPS